MTGGTLFSELGFYYVGPVDGHDVENLVQIFENVKNSKHQGLQKPTAPRCLHRLPTSIWSRESEHHHGVHSNV